MENFSIEAGQLIDRHKEANKEYYYSHQYGPAFFRSTLHSAATCPSPRRWMRVQ